MQGMDELYKVEAKHRKWLTMEEKGDGSTVLGEMDMESNEYSRK